MRVLFMLLCGGIIIWSEMLGHPDFDLARKIVDGAGRCYCCGKSQNMEYF